MDYDTHGAVFHAENAAATPAGQFFAQHLVDFTVWRLVAAAGFFALVAATAAAARVALAHVADLAETNTAGAKRCLKWAVGSLLACHVLILLFDKVTPWHLSVASIAAQLSYSHLVQQYPWVVSGSPSVVVATVLALLETAVWYWYLLFPINDSHRQPLWAALSFLIVVVWGVPIMLSTTLSFSDESSLPGVPADSGHQQGLGVVKRRLTLFNWAARAVGARDNRTSKLL